MPDVAGLLAGEATAEKGCGLGIADGWIPLIPSKGGLSTLLMKNVGEIATADERVPKG
ncbi:MAG: hypothetical protein OXC57_14340 [Rhodobacteraceae bacterium]|nr:hypothetical protein [Paracoccaceae bacterium]